MDFMQIRFYGEGGGGASHTCPYGTNCGPKFHFGRTTGQAREDQYYNKYLIYYNNGFI